VKALTLKNLITTNEIKIQFFKMQQIFTNLQTSWKIADGCTFRDENFCTNCLILISFVAIKFTQ
jgi:hypothetical protein